MTVNGLIALLDRLARDGFGHHPVLVDKLSFSHPLENDGVTLLDVVGVRQQFVPSIDGDGYVIQNKDGSERARWCAVLKGDKDGPRKRAGHGAKTRQSPTPAQAPRPL